MEMAVLFAAIEGIYAHPHHWIDQSNGDLEQRGNIYHWPSILWKLNASNTRVFETWYNLL